MNSFELNDIKIEWLGHASFRITDKKENIVIYIDPFKIDTNIKADLILITHSHYDHFSLQDIEKIRKDSTLIYAPKDCDNIFTIVEPDMSLEYRGIKIETYPMYNISKPFHPKNKKWVSYVIKIREVSIFHAGDTDLIQEFYSLPEITVALLPVGGTYTMDYQEAAKLCEIIKPKYAIPMHYGTIIGSLEDAKRFKELAKATQVIILNKVK